jgi:hypothetical protein
MNAVIDIRNELEPIRLEQVGNALKQSLHVPDRAERPR